MHIQKKKKKGVQNSRHKGTSLLKCIVITKFFYHLYQSSTKPLVEKMNSAGYVKINLLRNVPKFLLRLTRACLNKKIDTNKGLQRVYRGWDPLELQPFLQKPYYAI